MGEVCDTHSGYLYYIIITFYNLYYEYTYFVNSDISFRYYPGLPRTSGNFPCCTTFIPLIYYLVSLRVTTLQVFFKLLSKATDFRLLFYVSLCSGLTSFSEASSFSWITGFCPRWIFPVFLVISFILQTR